MPRSLYERDGAFFMNIFKDKDEDPTKPLEEEQAPIEPVAPTKPVASEENPVGENKSALNCDNCGGEGLVWNEATKRHDRCIVCQGTGGVN